MRAPAAEQPVSVHASELAALSEVDRYLFDLQGYLVVRGALDGSTIAELLNFWDMRLRAKCLHDLSFTWGPAWQNLIDPPRVYPLIRTLLANRARLDHAFTVDERFGNAQGRLHHHADLFHAGVFYRASLGTMHNGLLGVVYSLLPPSPTSPTFCAVPGSHKAGFPTPKRFYTIDTCPVAEAVYIEAGDAIIFNEALTHGTFLPKLELGQRGARRAIMVKYMPDCMAFRSPGHWQPATSIAPTPNYAHEAWEGQCDPTSLTPRQRRLVCLPPFHRNRR